MAVLTASCVICGGVLADGRRRRCGAPDCERVQQAERMKRWRASYISRTGHTPHRRDREATAKFCVDCGDRANGGAGDRWYCTACARHHGANKSERYRRRRFGLPPAIRRRALARMLRARLDQIISGGVWTAGRCRDCGRAFVARAGGDPARFCSYRCKQSEAHDRSRARRYGVRVESVSRLAVYERDGWTCQICGKPVDRGVRVPAPLAATIDHRIPLYFGGPHTFDNLQTAHFRCNWIKGLQVAS